MAVNKTINKRTNTHGAMRNCIEYVLRQDKTSEPLTYVTGPYRHDEIILKRYFPQNMESKEKNMTMLFLSLVGAGICTSLKHMHL